MMLKKIDGVEFDCLVESEGTYFCNGVVFENETDNVIAFPVYDSPLDVPKEYYEVKK